MKRRISSLFLILAIFSCFSSFPVFADETSEIPEEKISNVETNCASIKETLKRTQNADKNTRISLGRTYQTLLTDFITPLNVRLMKNNRFDANLADLQTAFSTDRENFNQDYISYSKAFETLLSIDCKSEPEKFYRQLQKTREERRNVASSATIVSNDVSSFIEGVSKYITWYKENVHE